MTTTLAFGRKSYLRAAFFDQHNLIVLFGSAALSLSFGSVWPLAAALGAECSWLAFGPRSAKFRAFVDARWRGEQRAQRAAALKPLVEKLESRISTRFAALEELAESVFEAVEERGDTELSLVALRRSLASAARAFLDFGMVHARSSKAIAEVPYEELQAELARSTQLFALERNLEGRVALRQEQKAIQRRLLQRDNLMQVEHAAGLKLGAIESGVAHLRARALVGVPSVQLATEADVLLAQLGSPLGLEAMLRDER